MARFNKNPSNNYYSNYFFLDKVILSLYGLYFILKPFYLWSSGLPQISDFLMLFLMVIFGLRNKLSIKVAKNHKYFLTVSLIFVVYLMIINFFWGFRLQAFDSFLYPVLFYLFNFSIMVFSVSLFHVYREKILHTTYRAIIISLIFQTIIYFLDGGFSGGRGTASFNNPNQLGYYGILCVSILMIISVKIKVQMRWFILGVLLSFNLVLASLSKASILSVIGLILFYIFSKKKSKAFNRKLIVIVVLSVIFVFSVSSFTNFFQENELITSVQNRINGIGNDSDDSLEGRGYFRITDYPQYWIFGSGEGEYQRFENQSIEFHSTLGNLQVSYGIVGLGLFILLIFIALKENRFKNTYIILFIMAYGFTHNGIRNSLLWILIGLILYENKNLKELNLKKKRRKFSNCARNI